MHERTEHIPIGRLVLVLERQLSEASRSTLKSLLAKWWQKEEEVTWVSGLSRASVFEARDDAIFYNHEFVSPEQAVQLLPWREVWLVSAGQVWKLDSTARTKAATD